MHGVTIIAQLVALPASAAFLGVAFTRPVRRDSCPWDDIQRTRLFPSMAWHEHRHRGMRTRVHTCSATLSGDAFQGAGLPRPELDPSEVPSLLMRALARNDFPEVNSGLHSMWEFAGDTTRFIYQNNRSEFVEDAHTTADSLPTSFYGAAMHGRSWSMEGSLNLIGDPERAWIATQIMQTISSDGRMRRWQWELRKHRRPPMMGAWFVESIGSSDAKGNFDIEG